MTQPLGSLSAAEVAARLAASSLVLDFGAACARIHSDSLGLATALHTVYGAFECAPADRFCDLTVSVRRAHGIRRFLAPQVQFAVDAEVIFEPFPANTHLPLLEWGMNFLLAQRLNCHLLLHSGVVERAGKAVVLPALPGSGKSTLTAALTCAGFRLLSDEFGVIDLATGLAQPLLRPIALKNESIGVIRALSPRAVIGPAFEKTRKGTVAHLAPDAASWHARSVPARPALIVFPEFQPGAALSVAPVPKARAFAKLAVNSFNYEILGPEGFDAVARLVQQSRCHRVQYGDVTQAVRQIEALLSEADGPE
jgi:HprK-related kinase A